MYNCRYYYYKNITKFYYHFYTSLFKDNGEYYIN